MSSLKNIEVVAAVIIEGDHVFATQRGYGPWAGWWEFPGGKMEPGETPREALRRELREELDITAEPGELLTTVEYDYPDFHLTMHCFITRITEGSIKLLEHSSARWLTADTLTEVKWLPADRPVTDLLALRLRP